MQKMRQNPGAAPFECQRVSDPGFISLALTRAYSALTKRYRVNKLAHLLLRNKMINNSYYKFHNKSFLPKHSIGWSGHELQLQPNSVLKPKKVQYICIFLQSILKSHKASFCRRDYCQINL